VTTPREKFPPEQLPGGDPQPDHSDEIIVDFYCRYQFWLINFARILAEFPDEQIATDSGFAVLTLIIVYFDLMGKLVGEGETWDLWEGGKTEPSTNDRTKASLPFVFEELRNHPDEEKVCNLFNSQARNGIAHAGFPNGMLLDLKSENALAWGDYFQQQFVLVVNPLLFFRDIQKHLYDYVFRLRVPQNPEDIKLRLKFLRRIHKIR
jgi:hypothetical protein